MSDAVAKLAGELSWQATARQYRLNWKSLATVVKRAVRYGLKQHSRPPGHTSFGLRTGEHFIAAIYHCCESPALTGRTLITLLADEPLKGFLIYAFSLR